MFHSLALLHTASGKGILLYEEVDHVARREALSARAVALSDDFAEMRGLNADLIARRSAWGRSRGCGRALSRGQPSF